MGGAYVSKKTLTGFNYFPTYHALTKLLLPKTNILETDRIFEPCAGNGDISKIITAYYPKNMVFSMDINPINSNIMQGNFLDTKGTSEYIITNPPYNIFQDFYNKAITIFTKGMYLLLPLDYLHGIERYDSIYKNNNLKTVFVFIRRPLFNKKYDPTGLIPTGATTFAWFYFEKDYYGKPEIEWLDNRKYMGTPTLISSQSIAKKVGFL